MPTPLFRGCCSARRPRAPASVVEQIQAERFVERAARVHRAPHADVEQSQAGAAEEQEAMASIEIRARPFSRQIVVIGRIRRNAVRVVVPRLSVYCVCPLNQRDSFPRSMICLEAVSNPACRGRPMCRPRGGHADPPLRSGFETDSRTRAPALFKGSPARARRRTRSTTPTES